MVLCCCLSFLIFAVISHDWMITQKNIPEIFRVLSLTKIIKYSQMWFYQINFSHNAAYAYLLQHTPPPPPHLTNTEKRFNAVFTENVHLDVYLLIRCKASASTEIFNQSRLGQTHELSNLEMKHVDQCTCNYWSIIKVC